MFKIKFSNQLTLKHDSYSFIIHFFFFFFFFLLSFLIFVLFLFFFIFLDAFLTFHHTKVSLPSLYKGVIIFQLHHTRAYSIFTAQGLLQTLPHKGFKLYRARAFSDFTTQGLQTLPHKGFKLQSSPYKGFFKLYRTRVSIFNLHCTKGFNLYRIRALNYTVQGLLTSIFTAQRVSISTI